MSDKQNIEIRSSVGTYLRHLREEKGLSIADVSARLYLQASVIEALEQDDHDSLPKGTYVHGYLQNYAKLLDTSAELVLAMYKENTTEQPEQLPEVQHEPKTAQANKWPYVILYLAIFISILLPFTWWRSQYALEPVAADGKFGGNAAASSGLSYLIKIVEHPDVPFYRAPNTELTTTQSPGMQAANTDKEFEIAPSTYDKNMVTTGVGPDSIRIVLTEDCWIEIFDADNEKVFYDLARSGQILVLKGTAPFSVLLGNAAAGTVEFNTIPFDTTPHRSRIGIARFVLGEDQTGP